MNTAGLTPRQAQALAFIAATVAGGGGSPSLNEIGAHLGIKKSATHRLLRSLRDRGRVTWAPNLKRSITVRPGPDTYMLPRDTQIALDRFCLAHQEQAAAVVADAVLLHIDMLEASGRAAG